MQPSGPELDIITTYFIYGLSFFTMGLAVLLEAGRMSMLAESRVLRPLAVFGLLHGLHEWMELFQLPFASLGQVYPLLPLTRIILLAVSFTSLLAYGVRVMEPPQQRWPADVVAGSGVLGAYILILVLTGNTPWMSPHTWTDNADVLSRYLIAVPSGLLAAVALRAQARQWLARGDRALAASLTLAAVGFGIYGLSQIFVHKSSLALFPQLTTEAFKNTVGIPIQTLRGVMAAIVAIGVLRAIHFVEKKRQQQLLSAQQERLDALAQLQKELEKRRKLRRELLRHTVLAQEEERARIARELHDETSQVLTAASLNMATLKNLLPDQPQAHELIEKSQELCRAMARGLHRLVHDLRPAQLDDLGLVPSLHNLADEARRFSGLKIKVKINGPPKRLDPVAETVLFRITQEAITNITRHAHTQQAQIHLDFTSHLVSLVIEDHGTGFDLDATPIFGGGCGLEGMRERAESVEGGILINSQPDEGTRIEVVIPIKKPSNSAASLF